MTLEVLEHVQERFRVTRSELFKAAGILGPITEKFLARAAQ